MATLRRTDSKPLRDPQAPPPPPAPPRECVVCCESSADTTLVKPCRTCETDYCVACLHGMFMDAVDDHTRMPPRCCSVLQIHTVADHLGLQEVQQYREKFQEWITPAKTYCPAPTCSAFISERHLPQELDSQSRPPSRLPAVLRGILATVQESPAARFFRGEMDITHLPGYTNMVQRPIDLSKINAHISHYDSVSGLTADIELLVANAHTYNGHDHPVSQAARDLFKHYVRAVSTSIQRVMDTPLTVVRSTATFACPKCHIAICTSCKQIEHGDAPCDTTIVDRELAMLESFGYKRCPRCKAGVKKMFGCSHMQCVCGAHWCYWCQRSIDDCDGACSQRDDDDDEENYYDSEDERENEAAAEAAGVPPRPHTRPATAQLDAPRNLDAGGAARWADPNYDFGEEPEEEPHTQVWSCRHKFSPYRVTKDDDFDRGDYLGMECNRCFAKVVPRKPTVSFSAARGRMNESNKNSSYGKWVRALDRGGVEKDCTAFECPYCRLVTCKDCKEKYERAAKPIEVVELDEE